MARTRGNKGLTLTELAIILGAMGLVMAAIWAVASAVWNNYQGHVARQQILSVVENTRDYYMNKGKINCASGADITSILDDDDRRLIPTEMRLHPNAEGGDINHALATVGGGSFNVICLQNGNAFRILLSGLKRENCVDLLMRFPVLMSEVGVKAVVRPGGSVVSLNLLDIDHPADGFPMTLSTASAWCSDRINEVGFDFKLRN